jgi:hypothetical protein
METKPLPVKWYGPYSFVETKDENVFTSLIGEKERPLSIYNPF